MANIDQYVVIGNPIAHSKSPEIHTSFAQQTQQNIVYERLLAPLDGFVEMVSTFQREGGLGANVTAPFKLEAYQFATNLSERARAAGAVNTLTLNADGTVFGDNTDGVGLVTDIVVNAGVAITDKRVLILGAGGAVRGVLLPLLQEQPKALTIVNRTAEKAVSLAQDFAEYGKIHAGGYALIDGAYDIVINATSAGLYAKAPDIPASVFTEMSFAYDMVYAKEPTLFMQMAQQYGAKVSDGLGMLVEQAAESFSVWRGVRPETALILSTMRRQMASHHG